MMISALTGLQFIEKLGRRPTLMLSSTGMSLSVVVITVYPDINDIICFAAQLDIRCVLL